MKTRYQKILDLIEQRQSQLHYLHEREYLAKLINDIVEKEFKKYKSQLAKKN